MDYMDDWEAYDFLNRKAFDILFDGDLRHSISDINAFVILRNAAGHMIGYKSSVPEY